MKEEKTYNWASISTIVLQKGKDDCILWDVPIPADHSKNITTSIALKIGLNKPYANHTLLRRHLYGF